MLALVLTFSRLVTFVQLWVSNISSDFVIPEMSDLLKTFLQKVPDPMLLLSLTRTATRPWYGQTIRNY